MAAAVSVLVSVVVGMMWYSSIQADLLSATIVTDVPQLVGSCGSHVLQQHASNLQFADRPRVGAVRRPPHLALGYSGDWLPHISSARCLDMHIAGCNVICISALCKVQRHMQADAAFRVSGYGARVWDFGFSVSVWGFGF